MSMTHGAHIGVTGNAAERGAILVERRRYDMSCDPAAVHQANNSKPARNAPHRRYWVCGGYWDIAMHLASTVVDTPSTSEDEIRPTHCFNVTFLEFIGGESKPTEFVHAVGYWD